MDKPLIQQDEQYRLAVAIALEVGRASVSMIQRRLAISYSKAQELVCRMLRDGLVAIEDTPGIPKEMAWADAGVPALASHLPKVMDEAVLEHARTLYANSPRAYRGTRPLPWPEAPLATRQEFIEKAKAALGVEPSDGGQPNG